MKDHFWPDPSIGEKFSRHCRIRLADIEEGLPTAERQDLRRRFNDELAHGLSYQEAYQAYEAGRIAAGASIDDPHFYDAFHADHGPIASPVGDSDWILMQRDAYDIFRPVWPSILLWSGIFAFASAGLLRISVKYQTTPRTRVQPAGQATSPD
jgi:hypothetical protein